MRKNKIICTIALIGCFLFLTASDFIDSIFPSENVLMTDKALIDFGHNDGSGLFDEGTDDDTATQDETPEPEEEPAETKTEKVERKTNQYRVRVRGNRVFWGVGDENFDQEDRPIEIDKIQDNINIKCVTGTVLYLIDDFAESETYKTVYELVAKSDRKYVLKIWPDEKEKYWSMTNEKE